MVEKGEFLSIMGPSGCGKSTLLNIMGLLDAPTSGIIQVAGVKVEGMKDKELAAFRNRNLGFVFQSFHLINSLNVLDNVELPLLYRDVSAKERRRLAEEVLLKVGLSHRMHHMPSQLSGGQCQRVAIARPLWEIRKLYWLMNRPVTWIPGWERKLWKFCTSLIRKMGVPSSWLPTMRNRLNKRHVSCGSLMAGR